MSKPPARPPRTYLVHDDLFGREGTAQWTQPQSIDAYNGMRAAEVQHHWALRVQAHLRASGQRLSWLEEQAGLPTGRASKLIRGHAHLSLRDARSIDGIIGPTLLGLTFDPFEVEDQNLRRRFAGHQPQPS